MKQSTHRIITNTKTTTTTTPIRRGEIQNKLTGAQWPDFLRQTIGPVGVDLLEDFLAWKLEDRPSSASRIDHPFFHPNELGFGPIVPCFEGKRHPWTIISGCMPQDVLEWLRQDAAQLQEWKRACPKSQRTGPKSVLAGRMVPKAASQKMNCLKIGDYLPAPRLRAWLAAFRHLNAESLKRMLAQTQAALRHLSKAQLGPNGRHLFDCPVETWFLAAGELHIFDNPAQLREERHQDGGASVLHLNVTLYGRRTLECFTDQAEPASHSWGLVPGSVYFGTLTGPEHEVTHSLPKSAQETLDGHSISINLRCCLFPHSRSRSKNTTPSPQVMFRGMVTSFKDALCSEQWRLPSLAECDKFCSAVGPVSF